MTRLLTSLLMALMLSPGVLWAQVAAPELTPAAPRYYLSGLDGFSRGTIAADNPAANLWGEPSRVAFSVVNLEQDVSGTVTEYSGNLIGYRGGWERFSIALQQLAVKEDNGTFEETFTSGHIALEILSGLSLGAGMDISDADTGTQNTEIEANTFGFSANIDEAFYIGYALGSDRAEDSNGNTGDRDTTMLGFAIRTQGSWRWHVAYDTLDKDNFDGAINGGGFDATTLTLQIGAGNWLLGGQQVELEGKLGGTTFEATVIDVGWAPETGLSVTARLSDGEISNNGVVGATGESMSVTVAYLF